MKNKNKFVKTTKKEIDLIRCKVFFNQRPFATKVYVAMKTGVDMNFIKKNWNKITS